MRPIFVTTALALLLFVNSGRECAAQTVPTTVANPVLYFVGQESFSTGGRPMMRYRYGVLNALSYPDAMFAAAPTLPPCGANTKAGRTWVDLYTQGGKRLNGFCALQASSNLDGIWFALDESVVPPSWIYIELTDRQTGTKYRSNLAETTN